MLVIGLAFWVVFTPERLTPIIRSVARQYITCEYTIDKVELTFVSTYPFVGLEIDNFIVNNPMPDAPNDTVLAIPQMIASLDVVALLKYDTLSISNLSVTDMQANLFVDAQGLANYDVLVLTEDTVEEDTTGLPFEHISVNQLSLYASRISYINLQDTMDVILQDASVAAQVAGLDNIQLTLDVEQTDATIAGEQLADNWSIHMDLPIAFDMDNMRISLNQARMNLNDLELTLHGCVEMGDTLLTDMHLTTAKWSFDKLMKVLPIKLDKDVVNLLKGGSISLDATAQLNLADDSQSKVLIHNANVRVKNTNLGLQGTIKNPLSDLWMDLTTHLDLRTQDVKAFLPAQMHLAGRVKGSAQVQMYLDDLIAMQLHKGKLKGDLQLQGVQYQLDGVEAVLPNNNLQFQIPNPSPSRKEVDWIVASLQTSGGTISMHPTLTAEIGATLLDIEANNILGTSPYLYATLSLQGKEHLHAVMDSMDMNIQQPALQTYIAYHLTDTSVMPIVDAQLDFQHMQGYYTDIYVDIQPSTLTAALHAPRMQADLQTQALYCTMGEDLKLQTKNTKLSAAARYNARGGDNLLLKWNPKLSVDMRDAQVNLANWEQTIQIPHIDFSYTNRDCKINQSNIIIGHSDFALTGELKNMGRWMRGKADLVGDLRFESAYTDVDEMLALFSAPQGSEEQVADTTNQIVTNESFEMESGAFLVPSNVDITLHTLIKKASAFNQTATNLGGKVYVRNGVLVIEEMGLVCNAAKLQLTAMYSTPRKNHIYVGLDYHMLDVDIEELIGMIPQFDSMMPMLRSFKGQAEFHLAVETYTDAHYQIKPSTLRGAASIYGKDLVVLDNQTFSKISKLLMFNKKTENKVDSISAELTLYKKEIDVYPFCVSVDNYMVALGGQHNLDMSFNYDINVLSPIYLGVNVSGNIDDLDIKLVPCKFAKDFKPLFRRKVDTYNAELRSKIRESMRKNVKIESTK